MQNFLQEELLYIHWWVELGLVTLLGSVVSRSVVESCGLRKALRSLSPDWQDCVPLLLVDWPLASEHGSPQPIWWARSEENSSCKCPHSEPQLTLSMLDSPILACRSSQVFYEVPVFFPCHDAHKTLCTPSKNRFSISFNPVKFL